MEKHNIMIYVCMGGHGVYIRPHAWDVCMHRNDLDNSNRSYPQAWMIPKNENQIEIVEKAMPESHRSQYRSTYLGPMLPCTIILSHQRHESR